MAPSKTGAKKSNKTSGKKLGATKDSKSRLSKGKGGGSSSSSSKSAAGKRAPGSEQKTKRPAVSGAGKKRRHYTEQELGIPQLNMITPLGVQKPRGKKKGKVFVDDPHSMMTIMAMVNAEKEGQIESKMLRARQMEEIRQLKREEQEEREAARKDKLEDVKNSLRKKRVRKGKNDATAESNEPPQKAAKSDSKKKKVSFG